MYVDWLVYTNYCSTVRIKSQELQKKWRNQRYCDVFSDFALNQIIYYADASAATF